MHSYSSPDLVTAVKYITFALFAMLNQFSGEKFADNGVHNKITLIRINKVSSRDTPRFAPTKFQFAVIRFQSLYFIIV